MKSASAVLLTTVLILILGLLVLQPTSSQSDPIDRESIKHDYWMTICADNQNIQFSQSIAEDYCLAGQEGSAINCTSLQGLYTESLHTNQTHPQCIKQITEPDSNTFPEYNITCILTTCTRLIEFNQLTGETRTIWTREGGWL